MKRGRKQKFSRVDKDRLMDLYLTKRLRMVEIEALLDMTYPTVLKALKYHDIPAVGGQQMAYSNCLLSTGGFCDPQPDRDICLSPLPAYQLKATVGPIPRDQT